ncbi:MAG: sulfatase-like hydrolase/transferase [Candidatus Hydrogenedens sp.]|nr:sulfatase-like hydrolase/transferase [Candidatus Hydrogenedens sp.]
MKSFLLRFVPFLAVGALCFAWYALRHSEVTEPKEVTSDTSDWSAPRETPLPHFAALTRPEADTDTPVVEIQGDFRETAWPVREFARQRLPLNSDGTLELVEGEHFTWPDEQCTGLHVWVKPTNSPLSHTEHFPLEYRYIGREAFQNGRGSLHAFPEAPPAPEAIVRLRPVPPPVHHWKSPEFVVPPDGKVTAAYGLLRDWALASDGKFIFEMRVGDEVVSGELESAADVTDTWHEVMLDLKRYAGRPVQIECEARAEKETPRQDSVQPFWSLPLVTGAPEPTEPRPNVVFIVLDTLRRDRVHTFGGLRENSPDIDAFSNHAAIFQNAISPATWTTPSHASMFTGALSWQHGAGSWFRGFTLDPHWTTIAELARDQGYLTAAFTEGGSLSGRFGFTQGFQQYSDGPVFEGPRSGVARLTLEEAWGWVHDKAAAPFFLFVQTYEIHAPYCSPAPLGVAYVNPEDGGSNCIEEEDITDEEIGARASRLYDGGVLYTDGELGQFLDRMDQSGLLDNTLVVITSDHGEEFGEHGGYGHTTHIYPELCHVPLIIRPPGGLETGRRIEALVTTRDLHATLAEYVGAPPSRVHADSQSFASLVRGDAQPSYDRPYVFCHLPQRDQDAALETGRDHEYNYYSVITPDLRYMITDHFWTLKQIGALPESTEADEWTEYAFDHRIDPDERQNLADEPGPELSALRTLLFEKIESDGELRHFFGSSESRPLDVSEESLQQMEALGYF